TIRAAFRAVVAAPGVRAARRAAVLPGAARDARSGRRAREALRAADASARPVRGAARSRDAGAVAALPVAALLEAGAAVTTTRVERVAALVPVEADPGLRTARLAADVVWIAAGARRAHLA